MPMSQRVFAPCVRFGHVSPVLDLQGGWDAYVKRLATVQNKSTPGIITSVKKSSTRIERDLGPLRFEMHAADTRIIETLMKLKTEQRARTVGLAGDPFAHPWVRQMMFDIVEHKQVDFGGDLCALYAGDTMVACHLGLRSRTTLHGWFSIYRPEHAYYQPALIMYLKLAQASADDGLELFDMGRGTQDYKLRLCTRMIPMGEGALSRPQFFGDGLMRAKRIKAQLRADPRVASLRRLLGKAGTPAQ
jgi:CelD/BcsL family acetyltransferase involved in cellulose biosynthesis